jgi:hypothetical protein
MGMYVLARILEAETEPKSQDTGDVRELFAELEAMEASVRASSQTSAQGPETPPSLNLSRPA